MEFFRQNKKVIVGFIAAAVVLWMVGGVVVMTLVSLGGQFVSLKKILNFLIFLVFLLNTFACLTSFASEDIEAQKRRTREKINRLKWLESVETNKLYKNQQRLESATTNLKTSKKQIESAKESLKRCK